MGDLGTAVAAHFRAMCATNAGSTLTISFIRELDGLRGIAILLVMFHRFWPQTGSLARYAPIAELGWVGVDLFFVISGFLITGILVDTKSDPHYLRNYLARRTLRIFPLYYLYAGAVLIAIPVSQGGPYFETPFIRAAGSPLWYLLYFGNCPEALGRDPPFLLGHLWSLAIEEQFYLTFPLIVLVATRVGLARGLVGAILLAPVLRFLALLVFPGKERVQYLATPCRMDAIATGALLAVLVREGLLRSVRAVVVRNCVIAAAAILVAAAALGCLARTAPLGRVLGYSIVAFTFGSVVLFTLMNRGARATASLRFRPLLFIGKICYATYLFHRPVNVIVDQTMAHFGAEDLAVSFSAILIKIGLTIAIATVSWNVLEHPLLQLKRYFEPQRRLDARDDFTVHGAPLPAAVPVASMRSR